jgi:hypothetical protein
MGWKIDQNTRLEPSPSQARVVRRTQSQDRRLTKSEKLHKLDLNLVVELGFQAKLDRHLCVAVPRSLKRKTQETPGLKWFSLELQVTKKKWLAYNADLGHPGDGGKAVEEHDSLRSSTHFWGMHSPIAQSILVL